MAGKTKKGKKLKKVQQAGPEVRAANKPEYVTGTGQKLWGIHPSDKCAGDFCVIHNPSDHAMRDFPTHWRADRGLMERICVHGIGHPDPDALAAIPEHLRNGEGVHGCDGCGHDRFELDEEFEPYFSDDWGDVHWCQPGHCPEPEWVDHDAPANGIGPVCRYCGNLIDWSPVDHALGCEWL